MAKVNDALRTCGLLSLLLVYLCESSVLKSLPSIESFSVIDKSCLTNSNGNNYCKYLLNVTGGEFLGHVSWSITPAGGVKGDDCAVKLDDFHFKEIETEKWRSIVEITVPVPATGKLYVCLYLARDDDHPLKRSWIHQGTAVSLEPSVDKKSRNVLDPGDTIASLKAASTSLIEDPSADSGTGLDKTDNVWVDLSQDTEVNYRRQPTDHVGPQESNEYAVKGATWKGELDNDFGTRKLEQNSNSLQNADATRDVAVQTRPEYVGSPETLDGDSYNTLMYGAVSKNRKAITKRSNTDASPIKDVILEASIEKDINDKSVGHNKNINVDKSVERSHSDIDFKKVGYANSVVISDESLPKDLNKIAGEDKGLAIEESRKYLNPNDVTVMDKNEDNVATSGVESVISSNVDVNSFKKDVVSSEHRNNFGKGDSEIPSKYVDTIQKTSSVNGYETQLRIKRADFTSVRGEQPYKDTEGRIGDEDDIKIHGFRVEAADKSPDIGDDGVPSLLTESQATLRLFGSGFTENSAIVFTHKPGKYGDPCLFPSSDVFHITRGAINGTSATVVVTIPPLSEGHGHFYMCTKSAGHSASAPFMHQGDEPWLLMAAHDKLLPLWASIVVICTCLAFSALFSGLNLGLMSMDKTELKIIANTGTPTEKKYALAIIPVRNHGNFLLCSILLGNVAVNSSFTLLLDDLTSGLVAVVCSTLAIVLLGEITPQAVCSRHGLAVGAKTIMITKVVMVLTAPISWPVSKVLDIILGEEIGNVYNRERLKELVTMTTDQNDLDRDEVNIISGALELRKKTVAEVMTKIEDIYMLSIDAILDFETVTEIMNTGYSRIPVYEGQRHNIVTVLFIKDLAFVDPSDNRALKTLCQFYQNPCNFVFEDTTLDIMFRQFKEGHKGHMAFVHRVNNEGEGDPFYETVGLVTLEDVIEELIQAEIVDETDVYTDNKSKRRRNRPTNRLQNFAEFAEKRENQRIHISPQLTLATFQFLSTTIDAFKDDLVSENVLRRLLRQDIIRQIRCKGKDKRDPSTLIYTEGKAVDYFALILEGRVEVTVGRENLIFEAGPFTYFGIQALMQNIGVGEATPTMMGSLQNINMDSMLRYTFIPDYSVRAITDVYYIIIKRALYLAAKRATLMEKSSDEHRGSAHFDSEVEKLFHQLDDDKSIRDTKSPSRQVSPQPVPASASPYTRSTFNSPSSGALAPMAEDAARNGDVAYKFRPADQTVEQVESESTALLDKKP